MQGVLLQKLNSMSTKQTIYYLSTRYASWFQSLNIKKESTIKTEKEIKDNYQNCFYFNNEEEAKKLCSAIKQAIYRFYKKRTDCPDFVKDWK